MVSLVLASDLDDWFYCKLKVPLRIEHGDIETKASAEGTLKHAQLEEIVSDIPGLKEFVGPPEEAVALWKKGYAIIMREPLLKSERFLLLGKPDLIFFKGNKPLIVDYKTGRGPPVISKEFGTNVWNGHAAQMVCYGILAEENFSVIPDLGLKYKAGSILEKVKKLKNVEKIDLNKFSSLLENIEPVPFNMNTKTTVLAAISEVSQTKSGNVEIHRSHKSRQRCNSCAYRDLCHESL